MKMQTPRWIGYIERMVKNAKNDNGKDNWWKQEERTAKETRWWTEAEKGYKHIKDNKEENWLQLQERSTKGCFSEDLNKK